MLTERRGPRRAQDIEGTVAPISYVTEVLYPYAKARLQSHLEATFDDPQTQQDIQLFRLQVSPPPLPNAFLPMSGSHHTFHQPNNSLHPGLGVICAVRIADTQTAPSQRGPGQQQAHGARRLGAAANRLRRLSRTAARRCLRWAAARGRWWRRWWLRPRLTWRRTARGRP